MNECMSRVYLNNKQKTNPRENKNANVPLIDLTDPYVEYRPS
jgi:hypothetical protein